MFVNVSGQWCKDDINAFILGQHAGLTLGPGSVNLMGARAGAARVAEVLKTKFKL